MKQCVKRKPKWVPDEVEYFRAPIRPLNLKPLQVVYMTVTKVFAGLSENNAEELDPLIGIHSYSAAGT